MSDTDRLYRVLKAAGSDGVHTLDLRREGYSGNPSQRATDVEKKFGVRVHREIERRNGRNGSRYKLISEGGDASGTAAESLRQSPSTRVSAGHHIGKGVRGAGCDAPHSRVNAASESSAPEGQLFQLPSMSAFTNAEAA